MTRYLFYFHYWQLPDEPIEAVIDFDPADKATKVLEEIHEEISYHTGVEPEPNSFMFVELFGLRPFNPHTWNMKLEEFVGYYGNSFVVIDLTRPDLGETSFFRPKQVAGGQRTKFESIGIENDDWSLRAQFETRLISTLIRWFQFFRKTKWLMILPAGQKFDYRVWNVTTEIPESNYGASWRIILPYNYPQEPPKLFISKKDFLIASAVDVSHIWKDTDGSTYYFISDVNIDSTRWEETDFLVDFLLTGIWNFLVRSLKVSFEDLLFYKSNVANPYIIKETPPQESIKLRKGLLSEIADSDMFEDDIDYKVEIAEIQEEIDYNEEVTTKKQPTSKAQFDDISEDEDDSDFEDDDDSPRFTRKRKKGLDSDAEDSSRYAEQSLGFDTDSSEEDDNRSSRDSEDDEEDEDDEDNIKSSRNSEIKYKEWVTNATEDEVQRFGKLFTWLLLRVPDKALGELTLLRQAAPDHSVFKAIDWRYVIDELSESQLKPFATHIIDYYFTNTERGLIFDTDREFLRETVLKKWTTFDHVSELRELLRKNVSQIKKVTFETLDFAG